MCWCAVKKLLTHPPLPVEYNSRNNDSHVTSDHCNWFPTLSMLYLWDRDNEGHSRSLAMSSFILTTDWLLVAFCAGKALNRQVAQFLCIHIDVVSTQHHDVTSKSQAVSGISSPHLATPSNDRPSLTYGRMQRSASNDMTMIIRLWSFAQQLYIAFDWQDWPTSITVIKAQLDIHQQQQQSVDHCCCWWCIYIHYIHHPAIITQCITIIHKSQHSTASVDSHSLMLDWYMIIFTSTFNVICLLTMTRSSAVADRPRDASCHWIFC